MRDKYCLPKNIKEAAKDLQPLEIFNQNAFKKSAKASQELCDFMLGLSLFSNDLKDLILLQIITQEHQPDDLNTVSPELGQYNGIMLHIERLSVSSIFEFYIFLNRNKKIVFSSEMKSLIKLLPRPNRKHWERLIETLLNKKSQTGNKLKAILALTRNEIAFHYNEEEIAKGYNLAFSQNAIEPMLSRGIKISQTRFYFADAAVQTFFANNIKNRLKDEYGEELEKIAEDIAMSISLLVSKFINSQSSFGTPTTKEISKII